MAEAFPHLNPTGQVFAAYYETAWDHFLDGKYDEANNLCKFLLLQPNLGRFHQAGCHLILAHSPDCYVQHAKKAVELYHLIRTTTNEDIEHRDRLIKLAEEVLEKAEHDHAIYSSQELTEEEYNTAMEEAARFQMDAEAEMYGYNQPNGEQEGDDSQGSSATAQKTPKTGTSQSQEQKDSQTLFSAKSSPSANRSTGAKGD
ncbi:uncharacterized protein E0L32_002231 [Thyridium curvatum]|uniref:Uncharacterized protein n=1 Tax=Thyridium curvatum TaxID=1093900 RepID=A0A507ACY5_9PEZI|nr:uncharacterized protein E0L32_002231 [Thyridium curvatum]TPX06735.1 hypothetical protein E0L32_002231 [Thyridium curvatum]